MGQASVCTGEEVGMGRGWQRSRHRVNFDTRKNASELVMFAPLCSAISSYWLLSDFKSLSSRGKSIDVVSTSLVKCRPWQLWQTLVQLGNFSQLNFRLETYWGLLMTVVGCAQGLPSFRNGSICFVGVLYSFVGRKKPEVNCMFSREFHKE